MYSLGESEEITGGPQGVRPSRDELVIATKVFNPMSEAPNDRGLSRKHIMLDRREPEAPGMDYVDLYQIHRFDTHDAD